jgi:hypothetical protein
MSAQSILADVQSETETRVREGTKPAHNANVM